MEDGADMEQELKNRANQGLFDAISNEPETAQRMIQEGRADINQIVLDQSSKTPLLHALQHGKLHIARLLLEHGADVSYKDDNGETPLRVICSLTSRKFSEEEGYTVCSLLLEKGADCNFRNNIEKATPFECALKHRSLGIIKLLLEYGGDITSVHALHLAVRNPHVDVTEFVLSRELNADCIDDAGRSPLHYAAMCNNSNACELLLKRGANVNIKAS